MQEFKTINELKIKLEPLLIKKAKELNVDKDSIFNFLSVNKWKNSKDLRFFEIVDDIIKLDGGDL